MQKITPFLWFDSKAEEAVNFYTAVFKNSKKGRIARYGESGPGPEGSVMTVEFELEGLPFVALNGGPEYTFSPAISFWVKCETQKEIDELWKELSRDGTAEQCGWLRDKFGVSWQIVPTLLAEMLQDEDPAKVRRVMDALMQMTKIDIEALKRAYSGK